MAETPTPAGIAAADQRLAQVADRLDRNARAIMRGDAVLMLLALAAIIYVLTVRHPVSYWHYAAVWVIVALGAAGGRVQALMIRSYRDEIRVLRARAR